MRILSFVLAFIILSHHQAQASLLERWANHVFEYEEVETLNAVNQVGDPFTRQLAIEYRDMANNIGGGQALNRLYRGDSKFFAVKGTEAAKGNFVPPERLENWNIDPIFVAELEEARARLLKSLDMGLRRMSPVESAIAQAHFDCWVSQAERRFQWAEGEISCRPKFFAMLEKIERQYSAPAPVQQLSATSQEIDAIGHAGIVTLPSDIRQSGFGQDAPAPHHGAAPIGFYTIHFRTGGAKISENDDQLLLQVAEAVRFGHTRHITIQGHADPSGKADANFRLSMQRAEAVRDRLVIKGVPANMIEVEGHGAPTDTGNLTRAERERMRRAEIILR